MPPVLSGPEWQGYPDCPKDITSVEKDVQGLRWGDTLIFVYATWPSTCLMPTVSNIRAL